MDAYIILRTWNRNNDNAHHETTGTAYRTKDEAFAAIADELAFIFGSGDEPDGLTIEPAPVLDEENTSHNRGALRFLPEDIAGCTQVEAWGALPEGIDDPRMADWYECFEVECLAIPDTPKEDETVVSLEKEYVTDAILNLAHRMWDDDGCPKDPILFVTPVAIEKVVNDRGYLFVRAFLVKALMAGRDDIPMVLGAFEKGDGQQECIPLTCVSTQHGHYYKDSFWKVDNLIDAVSAHKG